MKLGNAVCQDRIWLSRVLIILTCILGVASVGGRLGQLHWVADLLAYFHDVYFFLAFGLVIGLTLLRRYAWVGIAMGVLLLNAWLLLPYLPTYTVDADAEPDLRLYVHNLYYLNDNLDAVAKDITRYNPDVVFLMEYSHDIGRRLEPEFSDYPYRLIEPSRYTMGLALFSRIPLQNAEVERFEQTRIPIYHITFEVAEQSVSFVGGHPWPPIGRWGQLHRDQMEDITKVAVQAAHPLIVGGDFNASPWSYVVSRLEREASVSEARRGFLLRKTWQLNAFLKLPIDQLLVSNEWRVLDFRHGDRGGSDHAPLILDLALRQDER